MTTKFLEKQTSVQGEPAVLDFVDSTNAIFSIEEGKEIARACSVMGIRCRSFSTMEEVLGQLSPLTTGCLIIDYECFGSELADMIRQLHGSIFAYPVIAISKDESSATALEALRMGAADFCRKPLAPDRLAVAIAEACRRDREGSLSPLAVRTKLASLTERERQVMQHCLEGISTKSIARRLNVTYQTIDKHRKKALRKMGVGCTVGLVNMLNRATLTALGIKRNSTISAAAS